MVQIGELEKKQEKLNKRLKNAKLMRMDGEFSKTEYEEIKQEINSELTKNDKSMRELQEQIDSLDTAKLSEGYQEKSKLIGMIKQELNLPEGKGQLNFTKKRKLQTRKKRTVC